MVVLRVGVGVAVAALLAAPAAGQAIPERPEYLRFPTRSFSPPDPSGLRFELTNGIPVYIVPDRTLPLVDVVLALPVGDLREGRTRRGWRR